MRASDIQAEIRRFLVDTFLFGLSERLSDDGVLLGEVIDSTGVLELVSFLQDRFAISVTDDEVTPENFDSVLNITAYVSRKVGNGVQI
jgi:acyl carrier protein